MAKYIDAEVIESEEMKHYRKTLNSHDAKLFVEFMSWIDDFPTADVIERSKIGNAIEEIEDCTFPHTIREKGWDENEGVYMPKEEVEVIRLDTLLEILKRNIGE